MQIVHKLAIWIVDSQIMMDPVHETSGGYTIHTQYTPPGHVQIQKSLSCLQLESSISSPT